MRFLAILKSGVSVQNAALEFVKILLKKSWQQNELNLEVACDFVNDILAAIGLECNITPEQINNGWSYVWPMDQIQIYNFHYVYDFNKVEEFLQTVCGLVKLQNEIFLNDLRELHDDDKESPLEYLMQLIAVWCSVFKQLLKLEEMQTNKHFEEPVSRINFHLLLGMHELRKIYCLDSHILDAICNRLYYSALRGLFYQQPHDMIFTGLLKIFSNSYDLFYNSSSDTMNFFFEAFSVQTISLTPLILYQTLQTMLQEDINSNKFSILLNFLIEPYMLRVYFNTLVSKKNFWHSKMTTANTRKILQESMKFLNILQSKLLSLDCFSREFMEAILNLVFKTDNVTATLACTLYITMMKRKFSDEMILKHIMIFYVSHVNTTTDLKPYIHALYGSFEFLLNFNSLLEIITDSQTEDIIRLLSAHILVIVFELKLQKKGSQRQVQHLLQILPEIFENLCCQKTEGILLKVYTYIPIEKLRKPILDNFIHYAVGIFTFTDNRIEYPLLMNIFNVFHKCLIFNQEWRHLELLADSISVKYHEMIKNLKEIEQNQQKSLSQHSLELYNGIIKRLNIILKTQYSIFDDNYIEFIRDLSHYYLYNLKIKTLISKDKSLIDLYVLETIISCILKLIKLENNTENYRCLPDAQELFKFLWSIIKNLPELEKFPIVRIKTYYCCFLQLIIRLNFKLDTQVYHQLVQILIAVNFKNKLLSSKGANELQQIHPLQSIEYQRLMLKQFTEMHKYQRVQINTNMVWKLCIYYGLFKHHFQEELKNLIITLANYRFKIYKHIISVLIYNLYTQNPALKNNTIMSILKQHKYLIDNDIKVESSQLLKVHVVLMVLQILSKALSVQCMKTGHNRLQSLRHLSIFIEDLDLNQLQAKQLLLDQLAPLEKILNVEERKTLSDFKQLLVKQVT